MIDKTFQSKKREKKEIADKKNVQKMQRKKNCTDINVEKKYHCNSKGSYRYSSVFDTKET